jgi:hypothetical protein
MYACTEERPIFGAAASRPRNTSPLAWLAAVALLPVSILCATTVRRGAGAATTGPSIGLTAPGAFASLGRRRSHNGRYHAEVVAVSALSSRGAAQWVVRLTRRDHRRLAGAKVTVQTWMPETSERSPSRAVASYVGGGRYLVDGIYFSRPGWWNVALVVDGRAGTDSVAFNVVVR